jgi:hemolysin III
MNTSTYAPQSRMGEEIANSITHGVGIVLAIGGLAVLTAFASLYGNAWHIASCSVFGGTLVILYTASTLYHSVHLPRAKKVLRTLDHSAILLLIAGTYTPFTLVNMRGPWGWSLFFIVWVLAVLGVVFQVTILQNRKIASLVLYIIMGWLAMVAVKAMLATIATGGLVLLILGGLVYTAGIGFYGWKRLPYHHAVWHLFVLAGSILHFFAVLFYVIPIVGGSQ